MERKLLSRKDSNVMEAVEEIFSAYSSSSRSLGNESEGRLFDLVSRRHGRYHKELEQKHANATKIELARIYDLWQQAKKELRSKSEEISGLRSKLGRVEAEAKLSRMNLAENEDLLKEIRRLREDIRVSREDLRVSKEETDRWKQSHAKLSEELKAAREFEDSALQNTSNHEQKVREMNQKIDCLQQENLDLANQLRASEAKNFREDSEERKTSQYLKTVTAEKAVLEEKADLHEIEKEDLISQADELRRKLEIQKHEVASDIRRSSRKETRKLQGQIEKMKVDVGRLLTLLRTTAEYKESIPLLSDVRDENGVCFFGDGDSFKSQEYTSWNRVRDLEQEYHAFVATTASNQMSGFREARRWVPADVAKISRAFCNRFKGTCITIEILKEFVFDLNRVWQQRELTVIKRHKEKLQQQARDIKRRFQHQMPYENVLNASQRRLKKDNSTRLFLEEIDDLKERVRFYQAEISRLQEEHKTPDENENVSCELQKMKKKMRDATKTISHLHKVYTSSSDCDADDVLNLVEKLFGGMVEDLENLIDKLLMKK